MNWILPALLSALSLATADALTKLRFAHLTPYEMGLVRLIYALPWLLAAWPFIPRPQPGPLYYLCIAAGIPLEMLALYCYMRAIKRSPLSLTLPLIAFTPVFMILTGRVVLGEAIGPLGLWGIGLTVTGAYMLNLSSAGEGPLEPLYALFREPGSRLMLLVSFIYSLTSTIGKLGALHSAAAFFGVTYFTGFTLISLLLAPLVPGTRIARTLKAPLWGAAVGLATAVMILSHMAAIVATEAAYMITMKRTSLLIGILYGWWLFGERNIGERIIAAAVMLAGVFLIGLSG